MGGILLSENLDKRAAHQVAEGPHKEDVRERCLLFASGSRKVRNDGAHAGDDTAIKHERVWVGEEVYDFWYAHEAVPSISIYILIN